MQHVIRAAEALHKAHSKVLAALNSEFTEIQVKRENALSSLGKVHARDFAKQKAKLNAEVLSSHNLVLKHVSDLLEGAGSDEDFAEYVEIGEVSINAKNIGVVSNLTVPMILPYLGHTNIISRGSTAVSDNLFRSILLEAISQTKMASLSLSVFDPKIRSTFSAFSELQNVEPELYSVIHTDSELRELFASSRDRISKVSNQLKGLHSSIIEYLNTGGDLLVPFKTVVLLDYPSTVTESLHSQLVPILQAGPSSSINFLIQLQDPSEYPDWFDESSITNGSDVFSLTENRVTWSKNKNLKISVPSTTASDVSSGLVRFTDSARSLLDVKLQDLFPQTQWTQSSISGLQFSFAGAKQAPLLITLGDSLVHGLITGATGEGKSNLIKVMIYNLAARYSPDELQFILLDFKEGVTLAPLAPTADSPDYLPHARILGLDADQEFGMAVLLEIERIYKKRMAEMKPYDNISSFRQANPDRIMPRILVVIDEFQGLLAENKSRLGSAASKKLLEIIRTVRAAGIHIILASQEISSITSLVGKRDGLLSQTKLRVGLKNTPKEAAQTFAIDNHAAAQLKLKGEVVINDSFGEIKANELGRVPYASDDELLRLRQGWSNQANNLGQFPVVFDGAKLSEFPNDASRNSPKDRRSTFGAVPIGRPVDVSQEFVWIEFEQLPSRNLAIVGNETEIDLVTAGVDSVAHPLAQIQACLDSLRRTLNPINSRIIIWNLLPIHEQQLIGLEKELDVLKNLGFQVSVLEGHSEVFGCIDGLYDQVTSEEQVSTSTFVFGLGMDRIGSLDSKFGATIKKYSQVLQEIWELGPTKGIYSISRWSNSELFLKHTNKQPEKVFNSVLLYAGTQSVAKRIDGILSEWNGRDQRALYRDFASSRGAFNVIPFALSEK